MIILKNAEEIELMRNSGRLAADCLDAVEPYIKEGVSTLYLNDLCHQFILDHKAIPAPFNYHGFPKSICTSRNEVVCHGIPSTKDILKDGDIINLDVTTILAGYHGDLNRTYLVGNVKESVQQLVRSTKEALDLAMKTVKAGSFLGDIGAAIEALAQSRGYSVVRDFCGHGIGKGFHEDPQVLHYGKRGTGIQLKAGMTFTIEPMINLGTYRTKVLKDGWTAVTQDGKWSAQFEHTLAVTETGFDILTLSSKEILK
jgi:methionyl aminopeptidase